MPAEFPIDEACTHEATLARYCMRCGRKLRAEDSMKIGMGRTCAKKAATKRSIKNALKEAA